MQLTESEKAKLASRLKGDEETRDRGRFFYTFDAIKRNWIGGTDHIIWPEPNINIRAVINGEVTYDNLPYDGDNEIHKGMCIKDQHFIVGKNQDEKLLCEAREMKDCLKKDCEFFVPKGHVDSEGNQYPTPVCREFKIAFRRPTT